MHILRKPKDLKVKQKQQYINHCVQTLLVASTVYKLSDLFIGKQISTQFPQFNPL